MYFIHSTQIVRKRVAYIGDRYAHARGPLPIKQGGL